MNKVNEQKTTINGNEHSNEVACRIANVNNTKSKTK